MDYGFGNEKKFDVIDCIVLFACLIFSAAIGLYYRFSGGKQKTTEEYLLGDRSQSMIPVAVSLIASMMSSITLLGVSAEIYMYGIQFVMINIGYVLVTPIVAYLYLPVYFKLRATSVFEYLEKRFGAKTRFMVSSVFFIQTILYMGIVLYAPALTLEALTGISQISSLLITGFVCTFYSALGGIKAVIATDLFQAILMFLAIFIVIFTAVWEKGGFGPIWAIAERSGRLEFFNFDTDPTTRHTFWSLVIGGGFTYLSLCTVNQTQVQRYMTLRDLKSGILTLFISLPIVICLSLSTSLSGLALLSKYHDCDPIKSGRISNKDQLMPLYVLDVVGNIPGLTGFFVSGIFSAGLSTISAILNALSAVTLEDYIKPIYLFLYKRPYPVERTIQVTKSLVLIYGGLCIVLALLAKLLGGLLQASLTILGIVGGPVLGIFTLGMFIPFANELGGVLGLLTSLTALMFIAFGTPKPSIKPLPLSTSGCDYYVKNNFTVKILSNNSNITSALIRSVINLTNVTTRKSIATVRNDEIDYPYLYRISYLWYVIIGFIMTLFIGTLISIISYKCYANKVNNLNPDLFTPPIANYLKKSRKSKPTICRPIVKNGNTETGAKEDRNLKEAENSTLL